MRIAFVGVKRKYKELPPDYVYHFNRYHLELPFYFARDGHNSVVITTVDHTDKEGIAFDGFFEPDGRHLGHLSCETEEAFRKYDPQFDVVIHWRRWFEDLYRPEAVNVLLCQDHSFDSQWLADVKGAYRDKKLRGILCFPGWHQRDLLQEIGLPESAMIPGMTLGVDTDVYFPSQKNFDRLLWASDPGRGLIGAELIAMQLFSSNKNVRLEICYPDYVSCAPEPYHPAFVWHRNVPNGPRLWKLFSECGILPYTSTFREPSSRAHRQAQAAGMVVFYPPDMGTPSDLIQNDRTGIVTDMRSWPETIRLLQGSEKNRALDISQAARAYAISENWSVQAKRFNEFFGEMIR